tara:strand:- start:1006 stop:3735 length:2730 start_codon:yes stop_codon:yes gene_type:complete
MKNCPYPLISLFIVGLFLACSSTPSPEEPLSKAVSTAPQAKKVVLSPQNPEFRLANEVIPQAYTLHLDLDPRKDGFKGKTAIQVSLLEETNSFFLHSKKLNITSVVVQSESQQLTPEIKTFEKEEQIGLFFSETLPPQTLTLHIEHEGLYGTDLKGLYKVNHPTGEYLFTQMEPISARSLFPCFDEPQFKTPFRMHLKVPKDINAIANMPLIDESESAGFITKNFQPSPPLPTYLVAMMVGPFDEVIGPNIPATKLRPNPIPLRGFALKGKGEKLQYALKHTGEILLALEDYFGIAHPYPKIDIIAVPDFGAGAMENPGAITFREWLLLLDEQEAGVRQKRAFVGVMAHELVHQWFGNLVTLAWWDDLWLNEAFATFLGHKITAQVSPESLALESLIRGTHSAMNSDSIPAARQIRQPIVTHHDIHNAFDGITYSKGAGFLSMLESLLGEEAFRKGITEFLRKNAEGIATVDDLLHALETQSQNPVTAVAKSFLNQPGVPQVGVSIACDDSKATLSLSQKRYFKLGLRTDAENLWEIPFCYKTDQSQKTCVIFKQKQQSFPMDHCPEYLHPNADARGYYRFSIDGQYSDNLNKNIDLLTLSEKLALADSLKAAFRNGEMGFAQIDPYMKKYGRMPQRILSTSFTELFGFIHDHVWQHEPPAAFEKYVERIYAKPFQKIGYLPLEGESQDIKLQRQAYFNLLYKYANRASVQKWLYKKGLKLLKAKEKGRDTSFLQAELRWLAFHAILTKGTPKTNKNHFRRLKRLLLKETDSSWRRTFISVLGRTPVESHFDALIGLLPNVRKNEKTSIFWALMANPIFQEKTWETFKAKYDEFSQEIPQGSLAYTPYLPNAFCDIQRVAEVEAFFKDKIQDIPGAPRNLQKAIDSIRTCHGLKEKSAPGIRSFFGVTP